MIRRIHQIFLVNFIYDEMSQIDLSIYDFLRDKQTTLIDQMMVNSSYSFDIDVKLISYNRML
ncbi:hypothetical protein DERP_002274 [Dermatophagoides pteronyssinus]|uniref:Uncharacterized protein n=1 Tax=Dermatophagoides pteronyssinus TaxID=6956 RepID=A0ABQ8JHA3_DERPT|nr:hypothetical protein DERP_002274 [Dermatophagoides pteronyssinus]